MTPTCSTRVRHEGPRHRCRKAHPPAQRTAPARHEADVAAVRRAGRQGGLARGALSRRTRRARTGRTRPPARRASSRRGAPSTGKDPGDLRIRGHANDSQGAGDGHHRGDGWLEQVANLLLFGPPGGARVPGVRHRARPDRNGSRVLFTRTTISCRSSRSPTANWPRSRPRPARQIPSPGLDDLAYVAKDQAETGVLYELISAQSGRRSMLTPDSEPFSGSRARSSPTPP